jgi:peptidoglycan/LPS O-acetylase OafA/YrhL
MRPAIPALTSLRFFAAAWVVAFHESAWSLASGQSELITISPLNRLVSEGALAVNFFFMLSGFILAYSSSWHIRMLVQTLN